MDSKATLSNTLCVFPLPFNACGIPLVYLHTYSKRWEGFSVVSIEPLLFNSWLLIYLLSRLAFLAFLSIVVTIVLAALRSSTPTFISVATEVVVPRASFRSKLSESLANFLFV